MRARIFMRPKAATQSGLAKAGTWILDWQPEKERTEPLMGWWGSNFTQGQVSLKFDTAEQAVAYAEANGIDYQLERPPAKRPLKPKAYADNFRYGRGENWTH
ncbi:MAG: ETC complex I subunit [Acetobacteraceae bacterium]|nr:ETC complex I subunit [Acetobacteraceae bacterium]